MTSGLTLFALYFLYRHVTYTFSSVYQKAELLLFHVFETKKRHYACMALKAMDIQKTFQETCEHIQEYDRRTEEEVEKAKEFIISPGPKKAYLVYPQQWFHRTAVRARV